ncbi:AraC family transcriptional regulator [Leisingera aquaemixtae]|uniref:Adenosine deaminase n=1 Tax=Leisingera aquaemixtae TaxID=1396826 RepID=A0A0P1H8H3_9RHOB|nr:helix-turn-helix domain-containing protein [Leisingera aquaemixtae]CUH99489.1 Adenosine deaminase [Leisingera aquaemixtae]
MPTLPIPVFVALVLGFTCLRLWTEQSRLTALGVLLGICAVQSLIIALAQHYMIPGMRWVQPVSASLIPPAAWFAYIVTAVRPADRVDRLHGLVPLAALAAILVAPGFLDVLLPGAFVGYGIAILMQALHGADAQPRAILAYGNIPARIWLMIGAALVASALSDVLIVLAQIAGRGELRTWIITVFSVGNLLLIGLFSLSPYLRNEEAEKPDPPADSPEPDAELWERVTAYMAREKPYLDPDLTIARLARKLRVPAKALSTTINRATGENVSRFVNEARIRHVQAALMRGETVTEAMLSSGFNTKSNFNREFLRVAGASPSDWLQVEGRAIGKTP